MRIHNHIGHVVMSAVMGAALATAIWLVAFTAAGIDGQWRGDVDRALGGYDIRITALEVACQELHANCVRATPLR